jgi:hypothetical protein
MGNITTVLRNIILTELRLLGCPFARGYVADNAECQLALGLLIAAAT